MLSTTISGRIYGLLAVAVVAISTAGCAGSGLGTEYAEISEEDSGLIFQGPGLRNGYRRFLAGEDSAFVKRTIGIYGPPQGSLPFAQIMLIETPPQRHFTRIDRPGDNIKNWKLFENKTITVGVTGGTTNAIGRVNYAAYLADQMSCVTWSQGIDPRYDRSAGSHMLAGFYCRGGGVPMRSVEAERIVGLVGHREYGTP